MLVASIISKILGCDFPGPGTIYLSQSVQFRGPVSIDQEILYRFAVLEKNDEKRRLKIETNVTDLEGISLVLGEALVMVL
jgi:3-hydroxybutyryl-CoA dehydratase